MFDMIGKLWLVEMPEDSYILRLSTQYHGDRYYFSKFTLSSLEKNSNQILVQDKQPINGLAGLAIECDTVYMRNRKTVSWEVIKLLIGEQFYYVAPEHLKLFDKEDENVED